MGHAEARDDGLVLMSFLRENQFLPDRHLQSRRALFTGVRTWGSDGPVMSSTPEKAGTSAASADLFHF